MRSVATNSFARPSAAAKSAKPKPAHARRMRRRTGNTNHTALPTARRGRMTSERQIAANRKKCRQEAPDLAHPRAMSASRNALTARAVTSARPWPGLRDWLGRISLVNSWARPPRKPHTTSRASPCRRSSILRDRSPPPNAHGRPRRPVQARRTHHGPTRDLDRYERASPRPPPARRRSNSPPYIGCHSLDDRDLASFMRSGVNMSCPDPATLTMITRRLETRNARRITPINSTSKRRSYPFKCLLNELEREQRRNSETVPSEKRTHCPDRRRAACRSDHNDSATNS